MKLPPLLENRIIREELTEYWLYNARMEHAAIGAFARLSLELLSLGSPPSLLKATIAAQSDEIHHAELCFTLASHYAGEEISPGTYPGIISGGLKKMTHIKLARESLIDGVIGEGFAAKLAEHQSSQTKDETLKSIYKTIAQDEARHAELGSDIVEWILTLGNDKEKGRIITMLHKALDKAEKEMNSYHTFEKLIQPNNRMMEYGFFTEDDFTSFRETTLKDLLARIKETLPKRPKKIFLFA